MIFKCFAVSFQRLIDEDRVLNMEILINILLFVLGVVLIGSGRYSLKMLDENNRRWSEVERTYIIPRDVYYERRKETFEEAKYWVKKFQKYIPILSKASIACGFLSLLAIFFKGQDFGFDLIFVGYTSLAMLAISIFAFFISADFDRSLPFDQLFLIMIFINTRYNLLMNLFCDNKSLVVRSIEDLFYDYFKNRYEILNSNGFARYGYRYHINGRLFSLSTLFLGIFLLGLY
ncbi:MAG: hypothetical protein J6V99_00465 [Neisseriaceae bacterium]|nr:hypothetical protein [Neisseriaceae bacterium]